MMPPLYVRAGTITRFGTLTNSENLAKWDFQADPLDFLPFLSILLLEAGINSALKGWSTRQWHEHQGLRLFVPLGAKRCGRG
jgi:hypothetical protein